MISTGAIKVLLAWGFMCFCAANVPTYPKMLEQRLEKEGKNLSYYVFLKLWTQQELISGVDACSIVLPSDGAFNLFPSINLTRNKDNIISKIEASGRFPRLITRAISVDPFQLWHGNPDDRKGNAVLMKGNITVPAYAKTSYENEPIFVWKSDQGYLLANGARVLYHEPFGKDCTLIVTESFPFIRPHLFYKKGIRYWAADL